MAQRDGHIPDIYELGPPHSIFEFKCYTPFHTHVALGLGSRRCGGAASTSDGHSFAFGNTEELLRSKVLGLVARGLPDDEPLDRRTGIGRVAAHNGDYADAICKGTAIHLLATESSGALVHSAAAQYAFCVPSPNALPPPRGTTPLCTALAAPRPSRSSATTCPPSPPPLCVLTPSLSTPKRPRTRSCSRSVSAASK